MENVTSYSTEQFLQNITNETIPYDHWNRPDWIFPMVINISLTIVTLWLMISLIHFGIKTKKWSPAQNKTAGSGSNALNSGLIYSSVVACAIACIIRYFVTLALLNVGFHKNEDYICESLSDVQYTTYAFVLFSVYFVLWARQRAFYANWLLHHNYNKNIQIFSYSLIIIIACCVIIIVSYGSVPKLYISSKRGCIEKNDSNVGKEIYVITSIAVIVAHIALYGLFGYALTRFKRIERKKSLRLQRKTTQETNNSTNINSTSSGSSDNARISPPYQIKISQKKFSSNKKITFILKKTLVLAVVSIVLNVLVQVFSGFVFDHKSHRRILNMVGDIAAFFNFFLVIISFSKYKEMMTSPCKKCLE